MTNQSEQNEEKCTHAVNKNESCKDCFYVESSSTLDDVKEVALKICDLTGYGQELHPNDIIHYLRSLISKRDAEIREIVESLKTRFRCGACDTKVSNYHHTLTCVALQDLLAKLDNQ